MVKVVTYNPEIRISDNVITLRTTLDITTGSLTPIYIHMHSDEHATTLDVVYYQDLDTIIKGLEELKDAIINEKKKARVEFTRDVAKLVRGNDMVGD